MSILIINLIIIKTNNQNIEASNIITSSATTKEIVTIVAANLKGKELFPKKQKLQKEV